MIFKTTALSSFKQLAPKKIDLSVRTLRYLRIGVLG